LNFVRRLARPDAGAFALSPLIGAVVALLAGQETSWDFRNYHWYNAYSLLTWRFGQDVAVAHHATHNNNNPLLDVPYYLAGNALPAALDVVLLGAVEGLNFFLLYLIAVRSLPASMPRPRGRSLLHWPRSEFLAACRSCYW